MPGIVFLLDECVPEFLADEIIRLEPLVEVVQVGQDTAPPKTTSDPDLLLFAELHRMTLVTRDKRTMPGQLQNHYAAGHHTWGVFILVGNHAPKEYAEDLVLIWSSLTPEDLVDWSDY